MKLLKRTILLLVLTLFLSLLPPSNVLAQKDILILFSETKYSAPPNKNTVLYDPEDWFNGKRGNPYKLQELLTGGWDLLQIAPLNATGQSWIFVKP